MDDAISAITAAAIFCWPTCALNQPAPAPLQLGHHSPAQKLHLLVSSSFSWKRRYHNYHHLFPLHWKSSTISSPLLLRPTLPTTLRFPVASMFQVHQHLKRRRSIACKFVGSGCWALTVARSEKREGNQRKKTGAGKGKGEGKTAQTDTHTHNTLLTRKRCDKH